MQSQTQNTTTIARTKSTHFPGQLHPSYHQCDTLKLLKRKQTACYLATNLKTLMFVEFVQFVCSVITNRLDSWTEAPLENFIPAITDVFPWNGVINAIEVWAIICQKIWWLIEIAKRTMSRNNCRLLLTIMLPVKRIIERNNL